MAFFDLPIASTEFCGTSRRLSLLAWLTRP